MLARDPGLHLVDLTHEIPFADVAHGSYVWGQSAPWFPRGTVHLGVVDPGVGGPRRALAAEIDGRLYVAPDNGLLSDVLAQGTFGWAVSIQSSTASPPAPPESKLSRTFHGRDLFGPVAAFLAGGGARAELGPSLEQDQLVVFPATRPRRIAPPDVPVPLPEGFRPAAEAWESSIAFVDGFGNAISRLPIPEDVAAGFAWVAERPIAFRATYGDVSPGESLALRGSQGTLEIACNQGSAARTLGIAVGDMIKWLALERR